MTALRNAFLVALLACLTGCEPSGNKAGGLTATSATSPDAAFTEQEVRMAVGQATALVNSRRYDAAIAVYEERLGPGPLEHVVRNNLSALLLDQRNDPESHQRALSLMEQYVSSGDFILQDTLGWAYYRNGDYLKAIRHLEYAAAFEATAALNNPDSSTGLDPNIRYHLALAYAKSGITSGAAEELARAIQLAPIGWKHGGDARQLLKTLKQQPADTAVNSGVG